MRRILALTAVFVLLMAYAINAELTYQSVSVTATNQTITIGTGTLVVINDGSNEVYVRVFWEGETAAAATTASTEIKSKESFTFSKDLSVSAISLICAASETATVRLVYW